SRRRVHGFVRQMVIHSVLRRHTSAEVIAAKDFCRSVLLIAGIDSDDRGEKAHWEGIPRDVILMKAVTFCAGRLEDQLILEETCALSVELSHQIEQLRTARNAFVRGAEIDERVEAIEAAFAGLEVILPTAGDVIGIDEVAAPMKALRLRVERGDFVGREHAANDKKSVFLRLQDRPGIQLYRRDRLNHRFSEHEGS